MAAILPHLASEDDTTVEEQEFWGGKCASGRAGGGLDGLGRAGAEGPDPESYCPTPTAIINESHAHLLKLVYTRKVVLAQMKGLHIRPGILAGEVVLFNWGRKGPLHGAEWNRVAGTKGQPEFTSLLSWTSKMAAPSFSLPAGAMSMNGSCPGAAAGQSIAPKERRHSTAKALLPVLNYDPDAPDEQIPKDDPRYVEQVRLADAVCEHCYAESNNYEYSSVQFGQAVTYLWTQHAILTRPDGSQIKGTAPVSEFADSVFFHVMVDAIDRFKEPKKDGNTPVPPEPEHWRKRGLEFFRVHDSGDFFSIPYIKAWKALANHYKAGNHERPRVFWAPSRYWATGMKVVREVNVINGDEDSNLIIRPSGYHVNEHGPEKLGPGWADPTVVYSGVQNEEGRSPKSESEGKSWDWDCRAYQAADGPNCRRAESPLRDPANPKKHLVGCRACWIRPADTEKRRLRVNYTLH